MVSSGSRRRAAFGSLNFPPAISDGHIYLSVCRRRPEKIFTENIAGEEEWAHHSTAGVLGLSIGRFFTIIRQTLRTVSIVMVIIGARHCT